MFVTRLNNRQQAILLNLGQKLIVADGNIHESETALLTALQAQMTPGIEPAENCQIGNEFPTQESKTALILELLGLAHADAEYHLDESHFVAQVAKEIGLATDLLADMESWVVRQFALVREAEAFMGA